MFQRFSSENRNAEKTRKNLIFQNLYRYTAAGVPLGSSRGLFFRNPELRKTHFSETVRKRKKLEISLYLSVLAQTQHLLIYGEPKKVTKHLQNVLRKESD